MILKFPKPPRGAGGGFVLVPSQFERKRAGQFEVRVHASAPFVLEPIDDAVAAQEAQEMYDGGPRLRNAHLPRSRAAYERRVEEVRIDRSFIIFNLLKARVANGASTWLFLVACLIQRCATSWWQTACLSA